MKKIVELVVKLGDLEFDDVHVDAVALVSSPAIELPFLAFSDEEFVDVLPGEEEDEYVQRCVPVLIEEGYPADQAAAICHTTYETFESYSDYPEYIKETAQKAIELNEKLGNPCATQTGKVRAQQLAQGKPISEETIKRMYSYLSRAMEYYDQANPEACGTISVNLWGGPEALDWAKKKLEKIEEEKLAQAHEDFLRLADEYGESYDPLNVTYVDMTKDQFDNIGDIMKGIGALDLLTRNDLRQKGGRTMYRYAGGRSTNSRNFCTAMLNKNKLFTREDIYNMQRNGLNSRFGHGEGGSAYSIWKYKGGRFCKHFWERLTAFEGNDGRLILLSHGPAEGNAGIKPIDMPNGASRTSTLQRGRLSFSIDEEKKIVVGPVLVPNKLIKRIDKETGEEYFVYFSEKTVRDVAELLFKRNLQNRTNVEHASHDTDTDNTLLEQWIVDNPELDKAKAYGFDVPVGTLMQSRKINDEETWQKIKDGSLVGFSVEGAFLERVAQEQELTKDDQTLSAILDILKDIE